MAVQETWCAAGLPTLARGRAGLLCFRPELHRARVRGAGGPWQHGAGDRLQALRSRAPTCPLRAASMCPPLRRRFLPIAIVFGLLILLVAWV